MVSKFLLAELLYEGRDSLKEPGKCGMNSGGKVFSLSTSFLSCRDIEGLLECVREM
jgi:hypothetical protein